jgi:uncharacterized protein
MTVMHLYVGKLLDRPVGAHLDVNLQVGFQDLSDDLSVESIEGKLTFLHTEEDIVGYGVLTVDVDAECIRCLESVRDTIEIGMDERFSSTATIAPGDQVSPIDANGYVNLRPILRDLVIVSTPMHVLCKPDCRGICPRCGTNLNHGQCDCGLDDVDPRLAVLKSYYGEERKE